ncbi:NACHT N-terminal helical domain 7-containing protein [Streptomyces sp. KMM 9044]|uniref:NACHT N-terminal helical domain 7-containing protein n=1 Tax=Streptomyces sp. KMM 9044 TaxID=2744474 RepID=UPI003FA72D3B
MGVRRGARRLLSFSDALSLLGSDLPVLAALDRALGEALNFATGAVGDGLVQIADARGSVPMLGRAAVWGQTSALSLLARRTWTEQGRERRPPCGLAP